MNTGTVIALIRALSGESSAAQAAEYAQAAEDAKDLAEAYAESVSGALPHNNVSGSIVHITDAADQMPIHDMTVTISPVQTGSGDPSGENIRPITGWTGAKITVCGKNIFDKGRFSLLSSFSLDTDPESANYGYYRGNALQLSSASTAFNVSYTDPSKAGFVGKTPIGELPVTVSFDYRGIGSKGYTRFYYADGTDSGTANLINDGTSGHVSYSKTEKDIFGINFRTNGGSSSKISIRSIQVELGGSETAYEDYNGTTTTVDWTDDAGTVYGGTYDPVTGVLTVTHGYIASYDGETLPGVWMSDRDVYEEGETPTTGAEVVYELSSAITYNLDPVTDIQTRKGVTNMWANCGDISVNYCMSVTAYIDQLLKADADMVADDNITSGEYFSVGVKLFLATANIAQGADIIPGTNCTETSIAEALNTINS